MVETDERYYEGFEGEPEIVFIVSHNGTEYKRVGSWEGYFDDMLQRVKPEQEGWTGLAYYFHVGMYEDEQWLKDRPWHVSDLHLALRQLREIERDRLEFKDTAHVLELLIELIKNAIDNEDEISIYRD